ncbi:hypothetical protein SAMN04488066_10499 [Halorubrum aquaticum]|uniref:Uncharacterized protein n=1 Tax=Halorubrum aquaticum TaxID=387340 RepID=A0A1I3A3M9_9EURY|nr:hypothetical protein [Halorubrum aquaticum]SFH44505.1 hypothetical protein SAMN04488066_10499 [Halorubrum aquaticum]
MAPTLLNAALGALLAAALLGPAFDGRTVAVVVAAAVLPNLDAVASLVVTGATNTLLHNVWIPLVLVGLLYWDTALSERSALRERYGWRGVRTAWVALAGFTAAGVAPDLFGTPGANLLYPLEDAYYVVDGLLLFSTQDGIVQTFVSATAEGPGVLPFESLGTTETHSISTWVNPDGRPDLALGSEREFVVVDAGWQAVVVASALASIAIRFRPWARVRTGDTAEDSATEASR